jgi:hypothetical protein
MRVYIQQCRFGEPITVSNANLSYWFRFKGYEVLEFTTTELRSGDIDYHLIGDADNTILCGGVGTVREALERAGRPAPPNLDLPVSVRFWANRLVWESTMGEIRHGVMNGADPVHVKPRDRGKLFNGTVIASFKDLIPSASVPDDEPVLVQGIVKFVSEWRATILRDRIINVAHYKGDPLQFPHSATMTCALNDFEERPIGFSMDWGVTEDGETALVEVNDGFSLGNYGVRGCDYVAMIEARWRQLMGLPDNGVGLYNLPE